MQDDKEKQLRDKMNREGFYGLAPGGVIPEKEDEVSNSEEE